MPDYVKEYPESVIVQYDNLGASAKEAIQHALAAEGAYKECILPNITSPPDRRGDPGTTLPRQETSIKSLFAHIEQRWEKMDREAIRHTYLLYRGDYYGILLVQEGDFIRVNSIPCTSEECPTTPTPPS